MTTFQMPGPTLDMDAQSSTTPLVVLFERDDSIAVPLLSQIRMAGYDVRAARTPVELFDITGREQVAIILIDMGSATAGRREFWVALDTQRRGRSIQILTFRYIIPGGYLDTDFEPSARAIADVEVRGAHEFQLIVEVLRQRVSVHGVSPAAMNVLSSPPRVVDADPTLNGIAPIGAALGVPSPFMSQSPLGGVAPIGAALGLPSRFVSESPLPLGEAAMGLDVGNQEVFGMSPEESSPFAHPAASNPFGQTANPFGQTPAFSSTSSAEESASPFAMPYSSNPFGSGPAPTSAPSAPAPAYAFSYQAPTNPPTSSFEARAAMLSDAYAAEFGIGATPHPMAGMVNGPVMQPSALDNFLDAGLPGSGANLTSIQTTVSPRVTPYNFSDAWVPPESADLDVEVASPSLSASSAFTPTEYAPALSPEAISGMRGIGGDILDPETMQPGQVSLPKSQTSSPKPAKAPARPLSPQDESLGSVLVEGALLSEKKLETLQDMQQMLSDVQVDVKLGELAVLFKFLSRDQLLAAELVSRGLVTPQQIANLGRTKQDLASSGMEYNLADLLTMFDVLPEEQVRQICKEIAQ
jgi:hypothetical protein